MPSIINIIYLFAQLMGQSALTAYPGSSYGSAVVLPELLVKGQRYVKNSPTFAPKFDPIFGYAAVLPEVVVKAQKTVQETQPAGSRVVSNSDPIFGYAALLPEMIVTAPKHTAIIRHPTEDRVKCEFKTILLEKIISAPLANASSTCNAGFLYAKTISGNFEVSPNDTVDEDITVTGGNARIDGVVDGDLAVMGGAVTINGKVDGDVAVFGGGLDLIGTVTGDASVLGGSINHQGTVEGCLSVVGGKVKLDSGSVVKGSIDLVGGEVDRDTNAVVLGEIRRVDTKFGKIIPRITRAFRFPSHFGTIRPLGWLVSISILLVLYIMNALIFLVFPSAVESIAGKVESSTWIAVAIGFGTDIMLVPIIVLFAVSVIGIPLIPVFMLAIVLARLFGLTSFSYVFGKRVATGFNWSLTSRFGTFSLGWLATMIIIWLGVVLSWLGSIATVIRILGWVILYITSTIGLGATIFSLFKNEKRGV